MKRIRSVVQASAREFNLEYASLMAFIEVESSGQGFGKDGRLTIQFEPFWFIKLTPNPPFTKWSRNGVEGQSREWEAFEDACLIDKRAAMESTSIGLGQILGLHWRRLGYDSVQEMWDDAMKGIERQVWQICKFIDTDRRLRTALESKDWHIVASIYNGAGYKKLAEKLGREPYNISLEKAYRRHSV